MPTAGTPSVYKLLKADAKVYTFLSFAFNEILVFLSYEEQLKALGFLLKHKIV